MIKEAKEDYKRHKADVEVNNRRVDVLDVEKKKFVHKRWMDVTVGDIIIVKKNQAFAADLLFLTAENEEGTCYVETMNLDGETNLKIKKALDETKDMRHDDLASFKADIECEAPNSRLYDFTGNLQLTAADGTSKKVPINPSAVLLRGCTLRNTERVFGAVIYAGGWRGARTHSRTQQRWCGACLHGVRGRRARWTHEGAYTAMGTV